MKNAQFRRYFYVTLALVCYLVGLYFCPGADWDWPYEIKSGLVFIYLIPIAVLIPPIIFVVQIIVALIGDGISLTHISLVFLWLLLMCVVGIVFMVLGYFIEFFSLAGTVLFATMAYRSTSKPTS